MAVSSSNHSALDITGLRFRYEATRPWIVDITSFTLAPGEQVLLTGRSGQGKSTLLQLIAGLLDPTAGSINVAGTPISSLHGAARDRFRGRSIGMIFQTFNLLHAFTAIENVMAGLMFAEASRFPARAHRTLAADLLKQLGINDLDARVDNLSIGQQQRVAVARAVAAQPALVLADEPTASLDPENAEEALTLIQRTCRDRGAALLCVSHDPALAAQFTRRFSLDQLQQAAHVAA